MNEDRKTLSDIYRKIGYETGSNTVNELIVKYKDLQKENKVLKENAKHNDEIVDKVNWDNNLLKQQLKDKDEKISKAKELLKEASLSSLSPFELFKIEEELLEILESNKED